MKSYLPIVAFFTLVGIMAGCNGCALFVPEGVMTMEVSDAR